MKRWLSYIYPITKKIPSAYNGMLEITWYNGKKHLNTKNANYSYGSLQKILKTGLQRIDLNQCGQVLILGMGGGSVIETLQQDFNYQNCITALDIDPVIIDIAKDEFNISNTPNLTIICADALKFMHQNQQLFDLIIVDLFVDTNIPDSFFGVPFWKNITKAVSKKGSILFNASLYKTEDKKLAKIIAFLHKHGFQTEKIEKVNNTNTLLIAKATR